MSEVINWQESPLVFVVRDEESGWQLMHYVLERISHEVEEAACDVRTLSSYERWQLRAVVLSVMVARMAESEESSTWKTH